MSDSTLTSGKRPRHVRAHPSLDARLRRSQRADGSWVYEIRRDVYDPKTGKRTRNYETVGTRLDQAKARLAEVASAEAKGERVSAIGMSVREAVEGWKSTRDIAPRTAEGYDRITRERILPRWGQVRVRDITSMDIAEWLGTLQRNDTKPGPLSGGSKRLVLAVFSAVLEYAREAGAITTNPAKAISPKRKPKQAELAVRVLEGDELQRLLASCKRFPWLRPIVSVSALAGLRLGEILALRWQDVDFEKGEIHVRHSLGRDRALGPPKGKRSRAVPLFAPLRPILAELATLEDEPSDFVFRNLVGRARHPRDVGRAFGKARRYAKLSAEPRELRFHDLRHSFASALLRDGRDVLWVSQLLGHSDPTITLKTYAHVIHREDRTAEAEARLAEVFGTITT